MADIRLGLPGAEIILPVILYEPDSEPEIPTTTEKSIQEARMSDGSVRVNILPVHPKRFRLTFDLLSAADTGILKNLFERDEELSFINEYVSPTAYRVYVKSFTGPDPISYTTGRLAILYRMSVELGGTGETV